MGGIKAYENRRIVISEAKSISILHLLWHFMEHFGFSDKELDR
jgi:hypothetical protein